MTLVIIAAELDLSQGSVLALIGVVAAETMVRNNSIVLGLLAGVGGVLPPVCSTDSLLRC